MEVFDTEVKVKGTVNSLRKNKELNIGGSNLTNG
jgi:hypothetical protein